MKINVTCRSDGTVAVDFGSNGLYGQLILDKHLWATICDDSGKLEITAMGYGEVAESG